MKKKILLLIPILLVLVGCSLEDSEYSVDSIHYELNIEDNYQEKIVFTLDKNAYDIAKNSLQYDEEPLEYLLLIDNFSIPIFGNYSTLYNKIISKKSDAIQVDLSFNYIENDFIKSNYINTCFEKHQIVDKDDYLEISLGGYFYCLQDKSLDITINSIRGFETNGLVTGNTTIWKIDNSNVDNVNIYYKVIRDKKNMQTSYDGISRKNINFDLIELGVILIVLLFSFIYYSHIRKRNNNR